MTIKRTSIGVWASVVWLLSMLALLIMKADSLSGLKINDWGDFFAGAFAPLAFLWLVLGYLQQGEELRLSTQTLALQAEELRNSVEQQRALVEVSREQVAAERVVFEREKLAQEEAARPRITLTCKPSFMTGGGRMYEFTFSNVGPPASNLIADIVKHDGRVERLYAASFLEQGIDATARANEHHDENLVDWSIRLTCSSRYGQGFVYTYAITKPAHSNSGIVITQTAA